jgi:hypothetical protein
MKKLIILSVLIFLTYSSYSQIVFNKIIPDTVSHVTNSIIESDNGYIMLTGTSNEFNIRCFSLILIDFNGNIQYKKVYGDSQNIFWEGHNNNLKVSGLNLYFSGSFNNPALNTRGVHISTFDQSMNLTSQDVFIEDTIIKKAFNTIKTQDNCFYSTGLIDDGHNENMFLLLLKTDSLLNFKWQKSYGLLYSYGNQIIETSDKNILIGGSTFSFPTTTTDEDWYLIKLDTAGNVIWQNGFGKPGYLNYDGAVAGLIETSDSNYVACGGYPAVRSDCDTYWDGCIRKVSKDGNLMWERFYRSYSFYPPIGPTTMNCGLSSFIQKENDDLLIVGNSYESYPRHRGFLMRTDKDGNIKWQRLYYAETVSSRSQYLTVLQPTQDNGFILAGYGNEYDLLGYFPSQQAWLVKTDSLGIDGLCYTAPPELNIDIVLPATVNCSDTITVYAYIAGKSAPYTIETSIGQVIDSIYYPPLFVPVEIGLSEAEIDCGGNIIYTQQITEATLSNHEWGQCIAKPVEFYTPHTSGTHEISITVTDAYGESKTITKEVLVNDNCGSGIGEESVNVVSLYPNPAWDNLYLDLTESVISAPLNHLSVNCEIYNSMGQLLKTLQLSNDLTVINIKDFASGIYQIKIIDGDGNVIVKSFEKQ